MRTILAIEIVIFFMAYIISIYDNRIEEVQVIMFGMLIVVTYVGTTLFKNKPNEI